jgi:3'-5' exoribonuclease
MPKAQFIADFSVGDEVSTLFLIGSAQQGQARNGPFWKLELRDSSGSIEAKIWSPQCQMYPDLKAGDIVEVGGRISMYRERLEVAVDKMRTLPEEDKAALDLTLFMAASERPSSELLAELNTLCKANLTHGPWKKLLKLVLADQGVAECLPTAPAAKAMHHAYAGGLLEHTLGVSKLCMAFADLYPDLDRQTLLAGAVCHDLGKIWELSQGLATDYTEPGRLMGHMQLILDFLEPLIRKSGLEEHLAHHLKHLVLSHHGQYDYGSPKLPSTMEAFALHYADNLDAKLNQTRGALSHVPEGKSGWSLYIPSLERNVFRPIPTPAVPEKKEEKKTPSDTLDQLSLLGG